MSRLTRRLEEIDAHQRRMGNAKAVEHHLGEAGDALELAARVALGSFNARDRNPDESDVFRLGYLTACKELAVVLRCMRAGTTPEPGDLPQARLEAAEELGQARPMEPLKPAFDELGWLRKKVAALLEQALTPLQTDEDMDRDRALMLLGRLTQQLELALQGMEWT